MKFSRLATFIAGKEAKKSNVKIGDVREILAIISEILYLEKDFPDEIKTYNELLKIGRNRLNRFKNAKLKKSN